MLSRTTGKLKKLLKRRSLNSIDSKLFFPKQPMLQINKIHLTKRQTLINFYFSLLAIRENFLLFWTGL
jgi:hypothetical protein